MFGSDFLHAPRCKRLNARTYFSIKHSGGSDDRVSKFPAELRIDRMQHATCAFVPTKTVKRNANASGRVRRVAPIACKLIRVGRCLIVHRVWCVALHSDM